MRKVRYSIDWRAFLITLLRGETIVVPDLLHLYSPDFSDSITTSLHSTIRLDASLSEWVRVNIDTPEKRAKLNVTKIAECVTRFWPFVDPNRHLVLGVYVLWFCAWLEEVAEGKETQEKYIAESIAYIRRCLSHHASNDAMMEEENRETDAHSDCAPWNYIAQALCQEQSEEDRTRLTTSLFAHMDACGSPYPLPMPPDVSTHLRYHSLATASVPFLLLVPWAHNITLPSWIWDLNATKRLIFDVAMGAILVSDIANLKRNLENKESESAVPLMMLQELCGLREALDKVVQMLERKWVDFTEAGEELREIVQRGGETKEVRSDVRKLIEGYRSVLVAHVEDVLLGLKNTKGTVYQYGIGYRVRL